MALRVLLALVLPAALGCGRGGKQPPGDLFQLIQGRYTCVEMDIGGKRVPPGSLRSRPPKYEVRGNELIAFRPEGGEDPLTFSLDPSKSPVAIDFHEPRGDQPGRTTTGILKLDRDVLTIVITDSERPEDRPVAFAARKPNQMLLVLKRDKPTR